ncbi:MAG: RiPP maturation radical SAM C-methyltransferase [Chloroflexales bacterium]|nr:RiPP maturation radical SAM C-methyltransferase [Chloroflexales bacterium]
MNNDMMKVETHKELVQQRGRIALINMPFASHYIPSIGLSLLKATLNQQAIPVDILYLNLVFGEWCDPELYRALSLGYPNNTDLIGEWIFTGALYGEDPAAEKDFVNTILLGRRANEAAPAGNEIGGDGRLSLEQVQRLVDLRKKAQAFLHWCMKTYHWSQYAVVGFTSLFQQQIASLALARLIKDQYPETAIVFGGANCESSMGICLLDNFSFVDAVCSGEGDIVAPQLFSALANGTAIHNLPGIFYRQSDASENLSVKPMVSQSLVVRMDDVPIPDYDDYFAAYHASTFTKLQLPRVLFETSRGCWWGVKSHCAFCGLNGVTMAFRTKSATRVIEELGHLHQRYGHLTSYFSAVDNILSMSYFKDVIPALQNLDLPLNLFYEVKANLNKEQVHALARAGIRYIQPGIESLSTSVLKLMGKGATFLQNVRLLKWCKQYGIHVHWNFLFGFPGEDASEYDYIAKLIPLLTHLDAPDWGRVRFDHFSPYFSNPKQFGLVNVKPYPAYSYIYPLLQEADLFRIAYYFEAEFAGADDVSGYTHLLRTNLAQWKQAVTASQLLATRHNYQLVIWDHRLGSILPVHVLEGLRKEIYELCADITNISTLYKFLTASTQSTCSEAELAKELKYLVEQGLIVQEGTRYLALAVSPEATIDSQIELGLRRPDGAKRPSLVVN